MIDPGLLLGATAKKELSKVAKRTKPVFAKTAAVTSILVSSADKSIYVIQNGDIVAEGKAEIANPKKPLGSNVFVLEGGDENGFTWEATGFSSGGNPRRSRTPPRWSESRHRQRCKPRSISAWRQGWCSSPPISRMSAETRTGKDFTIMNTGGSDGGLALGCQPARSAKISAAGWRVA